MWLIPAKLRSAGMMAQRVSLRPLWVYTIHLRTTPLVGDAISGLRGVALAMQTGCADVTPCSRQVPYNHARATLKTVCACSRIWLSVFRSWSPRLPPGGC
jgi:hypothetical protein